MVVHLVMFTSRVMVIKMSKMADFMYFLLETGKYQFQFGQDIYGLIWPCQKIILTIYFRATISKISTFKNTGFWYTFVHSEIFLFTHDISQTVTSKAY